MIAFNQVVWLVVLSYHPPPPPPSSLFFFFFLSNDRKLKVIRIRDEGKEEENAGVKQNKEK